MRTWRDGFRAALTEAPPARCSVATVCCKCSAPSNPPANVSCMSKAPAWFIIATALIASPARADPDETKRDEAALRAVDDHWGRAEEEGDVAYLAQLLAPEYRSIRSTGKATPRAALLEHSAHNASSPTAREAARKARQAFMAAHPTGVSVVLHGQIGIVSYYNSQRGGDEAVRGAGRFGYGD